LLAFWLLPPGLLAFWLLPRRFRSHCRFGRRRLSRCCRLFQRIQGLFDLLSPCCECLLSRFQIALSFEGLSVGGRCLRLSRLLTGFCRRRLQLLFRRCRLLTGSLLNALRGSRHIRCRRLHIFSQLLLPLLGGRQLILSRSQLTAEIRLQTFRRLLQLLQRLRRFCRILFCQLRCRIVRSQGRHGSIVHSLAILLRRLHSLSCPVLLPSSIIEAILHGLPLLLLSRQLLLQTRIRRLLIQLLLSLLYPLVGIPHFILRILHCLLGAFHGVFRLLHGLVGRPFLLFTKCLSLFF
jgi:hypothetical protein